MNIDRRLLALIGPEKAPFVLSIAASTAVSVALIGQAAVLSLIISRAFLEESPPASLLPPIGLFALLSILRMLFGWLAHAGAKRASTAVRLALFERLTRAVALRGPLFTRSLPSGRLSTTLLKGIESLDAYFSQYLPQLFLALAAPVLILGAVFPQDPVSGFILLGTAPLIPLFMALIGRRAGAMTDRQWESLSRMSGYFLDMLQGMTTLKLFARSRSRRDAVAEAGEGFRKATMQVLRVAFLSSLTLELVGTIGTAMVAVGIGLRLLSAGLEFRTALFILLLTPDFYLPLRQLGLKFHAGMEGVSASREIFGVLDLAAESDHAGEDEKNPAPPADPGRSDIRFEGVGYSYPGADARALNNLSCTVEAGLTTALTGPSGAGKSTLVNLLLRFQSPDEGTFTLAGRPIGEFDPEEWRERIAWVPQHPFLFSGTLRENIMMANRRASGEELLRAVRSAGLEELVGLLPEGLDTPLGEGGARFSGGEAQRIALARAFIRDASLVVLDEPTSHTDPELEMALNRSMRELVRGRTALIIAHRPETIRTADRILVLEEGRLRASGTHAELMEEDAFYREAFATEGEERP
ncbi:thiol reductant ABC exporter subunit CydD [Chlorobium sp. N1]|uniref:thiol reductant ABC exporter subunit CydD n=1 Tax=Chlorobium sp. N1 TaxID=2491138 RepID=UPI00103A67C2|nr:thiol reductant ABC exporter subunit CydD [Chlorobium sp. N1]TCD47643.1 thiol reductant ABC exporter subunit CydD [Chlorobium sp. N1]